VDLFFFLYFSQKKLISPRLYMALGRADPGEFIILAIFTNEILYSVEVV